MTKRTQSTQAQAARIIRKELKSHGVDAKVRSSSASMMTAVDVDLYDAAPWTVRKVTEFVKRFQYGHFDGMQDLYEVSNRRDDLPQVKFAQVQANYSDDLRAEAETFCANYWMGWGDMNDWDRESHITQTLADDQNFGRRFWTARKPRQRAA